MPAPVATKSKTTCRTVSKIFMSFTTRALAFELSRPSNVTYCCCCKAWCSIFWICNKKIIFNHILFSITQWLTLVWQCSNISWISLTLSSLWYCTFSSMSTKACFRFSTSFWCNSVKSFICSSNLSVRNRSSYKNKQFTWKINYNK